MLAAILAEDDAFSRAVTHRSRLQKYSVVRYRDPVKLADSLHEIHPDLLIVRFEDYPFHWEVLAAELLCSESLRGVKILVFASSEIDAAHNFKNLRWIPELSGLPNSGSLSQETSKLFSEYLSPSVTLFKPPEGSSTAGEPKPRHSTKSRLMAAVEKQARSQQ
ncbi:MAG TPA: hypothetical protein VN445_03425 [Rectinemataceae bacterium]|nr:hypothetical protein [Rectinemataceae bacterium]